MNRTLTTLFFDEARLLFFPLFRDGVLASLTDDPLVYNLYPILWVLTIVATFLFNYYHFVHCGQAMILQDLAEIHPEDRNESIRKWCRNFKVQLKFVEDLEDTYNDEYEYQDEKDVLIEVA